MSISTTSAADVATTPPAGAVPHNRHDLLDPPDLAGWTPTQRVSVVIPHYQAREELARTLAGLAVQSVPRELVEVIVVDDGSDPPLALTDLGAGGVAGASEPDLGGLDVRVLHQPRDGFGAARARNLGASVATGEVLVFLDADMLPHRQLLAAHLRWHAVCPVAVTLGMREHVDVDDLTPTAIAAALAADDLDVLLAERDRQAPTWIADHLARTDGLRTAHDDLFRVVTSGNLGVSRALFEAVGGFDATFDRWGGEDTELGARLFVAGAVLVPEPAARCWHQGAGHEPDAEEARSLTDQRGRLAHLIAHRGFRPTTPGRSFTVPRVAVHVDAAGAGRDAIAASVVSALASDLHDLEVVVAVPAGHPDAWWLTQHLGADPRVRLTNGAGSAAQLPAAVPIHVALPAGVLVGPEAVTRLVERLTDPADPVGVVAVTVAGRRPSEVRLRAWTTRAVARVRWTGAGGVPADRGVTGAPRDLADGADTVLEVAGELFGSAWLPGRDIGVRWLEVTAGDGTDGTDGADGAAPAAGAAGAQDDARALLRLLERLDPDQRQELVGAAATVLTQLPPGALTRLLPVGRRVLAALPVARRVWAARRSRRVRLAAAVSIGAIGASGAVGWWVWSRRGRR